MVIKPWTVLETKYLHPGIRLDQCELSDGHILDYEVLDYADEIMVFPMTKDRQVVLIKQYRHGVQDVILELPGGSVDDGETPLDASRRELMEETGVRSLLLETVSTHSRSVISKIKSIESESSQRPERSE